MTLTSLVLALLAIIYAVFSNSKSIQHITTLTNISNDVKKTTSELNSISEKLETKIELIPTILKKVETKTDETQFLDTL